MLEVINSEINEIDEPFAIKKMFYFIDKDVSKNQYELIKERLLDYFIYQQPKYLIEFKKPEYEQSTKTLSIDMTIILPDKIFRQDNEKRSELFEEQKTAFKKFYEILKQAAI
jgi:hypothetical protein